MKFDFFEKLSPEEARAFLQRFLELESTNTTAALAEASAGGLVVDFSIESVPAFMRWLTGKITVIPKNPDPRLPEWIRNTDSYAKNLFEFDEPSKITILRAAYYLGESFVRSGNGLRWSNGNKEMAQANMPVVAGFEGGFEMPPILMAENYFGRAIAEPTKVGDIDKAVAFWKQRI